MSLPAGAAPAGHRGRAWRRIDAAARMDRRETGTAVRSLIALRPPSKKRPCLSPAFDGPGVTDGVRRQSDAIVAGHGNRRISVLQRCVSRTPKHGRGALFSCADHQRSPEKQTSAVRRHSRRRHKHSGAGSRGNPAASPRKTLGPRSPPAREQASRGRHGGLLRTVFPRLLNFVANQVSGWVRPQIPRRCGDDRRAWSAGRRLRGAWRRSGPAGP